MTKKRQFNGHIPPDSLVGQGAAPDSSGARVFLYIDGFNFYYNSLKQHPECKWLDLGAMAQKLFPKDSIIGIKYFTAKVSAYPNDPEQPFRQQIYFKALTTYINNLDIIYGHFLQNNTWMKQAHPPYDSVEVIKTEEKGSDVNLAVHMLDDAWKDKYDVAALLSSDSDMAESVRLVRHRGKKVCWVRQVRPRHCRKLQEVSSFVKRLPLELLKVCQLPSPIPGTNIRKPSLWEQ